MNIFDIIKQRILSYIHVEKVDDNPKSTRYTFINNENTIQRQKLDECRVWYIGDSDELQNYYTNQDMGGFAKEPIYNRNKPNYFWAIAVKGNEEAFKKVHSGIPKAAIDTISNVVGVPTVSCEGYDETIKELISKNDFNKKLSQESRPLTLVEGYGAWKVNMDKSISDYPIFEYYEGRDVDYVVKKGVIIGIIYKDYYKYKKKDYVLMETRRVERVPQKAVNENGEEVVVGYTSNSIIEYELFRLSDNEEVTKVLLDTIPELANLPQDGQVIPGLDEIMGVPSQYLFDCNNKDKGRSIFEGKIDIFDDMDQCLSQASQTDRVSTPVEYIPLDKMEKDSKGNAIKPSVFNRQYVESVALPDGDGKINGEIKTTQPELHYDQYIMRFKHLLDVALIGMLSPSTMGIDIARKDNADAQREKEKVTIFTRDSGIIPNETPMVKKLFSIALKLKEYMDTGSISLDRKYDISVKYKDFANPSYESMVATLLPMLNTGGISPKMFVDKLYRDSLSDEDKAYEIANIEEARQKDNINLGDFGLNGVE